MVKFKNTIGEGCFMKKLAVLGVFLAVLSTSAFALPEVKVSIGAGGFFQDYWTEYDSSNAIVKILAQLLDNNYAGGGFYGFFDATFVEANVGLALGSYKLDISGSPSISLTRLNLALYGKYPFVINDKATIFPLAGFDYNIFLSGKQGSTKFERSDLLSTQKDQWDAFLWSIGGGMDYHINSNLYIRGELRWGFRLRTESEKLAIKNLETATIDVSLFSTGPKFNLALGYTF
jgi:opacity protein-like surface antigen